MEFKAKSGLKSYSGELSKMARRFQWATAYYLTELSVRNRTEELQILEKNQVVRDKKFMSRQLRFERANGREPVKMQVARSGSLATKRFSGWSEQITGGTLERTPAALMARGGKEQVKIKGSMRLNKSADMLSDRTYPMGSQFQRKSKLGLLHSVKGTAPMNAAQRAHAYLRILSRNRAMGGRPFLLLDHAKLAPGIWQMRGRFGDNQWPKMRLLRAFDRTVEIKRLDWRQTARVNVMSSNTTAIYRESWNKSNVVRKKKHA